jgi:DNA-binding MarR family transcriptional regulator
MSSTRSDLLELAHAPGTRTIEGYECAQAWSALTAVHRLVSEALADALAARVGLSLNDFEVLLALAHTEPRPAQLCDLNASVPLSQPAFSRLVARLEERLLVTRAGTPKDRRGILVALTASGRETLRRAVAVHAECIGAYFTEHLRDDEQHLLVEALSRVRSGACADRGT